MSKSLTPSKFRSGFERALATQLESLGIKFGYESKELPYSINHIYNPDFILPNGIIIEAKGYFRNNDKAKMLQIKATYPHLDIRFVFMDPDKLVSRTKQTHAEWADRHGFPWAGSKIPLEWLAEPKH